MKSDKLQDAVGLVRDDFVNDAEFTAEKKVTFHPWVKWVAVAACLAVAALIAVPALNGKAPEVEAEPTDVTELAPIEAPGSEPIYISTGLPLPERAEGTGMAGGFAYMNIRTVFASYDELATYVQDPLFAAFAASDDAQQYSTVYEMDEASITTGPAEADYRIQGIVLSIDGSREPAPRAYVGMDADPEDEEVNYAEVSVARTLFGYSDQGFVQADQYGVRTDYLVDGVAVQKYDPIELYLVIFEQVGDTRMLENTQRQANEVHLHWSRINAGGAWYEIVGCDEDKVDAIAAYLAHFAHELYPDFKPEDIPESTAPDETSTWAEETAAPSQSTVLQSQTDDPVFAAFAESSFAKDRFISFGSAPFEVSMDVSGVTVTRHYDALGINGNFPAAEQFGVLSKRSVDGCEIQKFDLKELFAATGEPVDGDPWYCERVSVGDAWYHVTGDNEAEVDAVADAIAHVAATL